MHDILTSPVYAGTLEWGANGRCHQQSKLEPVRVEDAFPALVDRDTFQCVQDTLKERAPKVIAPRRVSSPYLLSGLLRCGLCGAAMFGQAAKSGRFHYYVCATAFRQGRQACAGASVPQELMEQLVLERVQDLVLKEDHIEELVRLTNGELAGSLAQLKEHLGVLDSQLKDVDNRLESLYEALETRKLSLEDLAPRIQELRKRRDLLGRARAEAAEALEEGRVRLLSRQEVLGYLNDLKGLLSRGTVGERRTLLRSFLREVVKEGSQVTLHYALPLPPAQVDAEPQAVLDFAPYGGACGVRTRDLRLERAVS